MELVKCINGHFYDGEKYSVCPHCNSGEVTPTAPPDITPAAGREGDETMALEDKPPVTRPDDAKEETEDEDGQVTISVLEDQGGKPIVGWLVCIEGGMRGESYELHAGMNFIGRNRNNHVCIPTDRSISREKHGIVIYDPKSGNFLVQSGMSAELLYLNDKVVLQPITLEPYDALLLGETKFLFVPFCGEKFTWE